MEQKSFYGFQILKLNTAIFMEFLKHGFILWSRHT